MATNYTTYLDTVSRCRQGMVNRLQNIFTRVSGVLRRVIKMAENATGEKRAAEEEIRTTENVKKKKKQHVVTLGKSEGFKRKVALLVAYNGNGYYGVQINRGFKTIESEIFLALVKAEAVPQAHVDDISKMWFQRGSRTDKGVSAVGQIFSLKMVIVPDVISKLNEHLPEQIRVLGCTRTTNGFDAKNFCCGRTYMYMSPTFAFAPLEKFITDDYRITDDRLDHVRRLLKMYVGTHKFHNFTSGVKYEQANASRYIISFECSDPYVREGMEFVTIRVKGQSFMLHQIRKMIGLTIAILRGYCTEVALAKSWAAERVDIPKAPGLGLVLESLHFDGYNKKFGCDGIHEPIDWAPQKDTMDEFKEKHIISDIVQQEKKDKVMLNWLQTLQFHNFDVTRDEGPQKPWVRREKDLLNAPKGSQPKESSPVPSSTTENDLNPVHQDKESEPPAESQVTSTTPDSRLEQGDCVTHNETESHSNSESVTTENVVDTTLEKAENVSDSGEIVPEPMSTDLKVASEKELQS